MNFRRNLLLAGLAAATLCATGVQAQDNVLRTASKLHFKLMQIFPFSKHTGKLAA